MKSSKLLSFVPALAALLLIAPGARAQGVTGRWNVEFDSRMAMSPGGEPVVEDRAKARLTLEQHGDSISGSWLMTSPPPAGRPAPTQRQVRGIISGKTIRFTTGPTEATINRNGEESKVQVITDYEATIDGDKLAGTMTSHAVDGSMGNLARKFDGARAKS
jgi:hypothetical protein